MSLMNDTGIIDPARAGLANNLRVVSNCSLYNSVILGLYLKLCILSNCRIFKKKQNWIILMNQGDIVSQTIYSSSLSSGLFI